MRVRLSGESSMTAQGRRAAHRRRRRAVRGGVRRRRAARRRGRPGRGRRVRAVRAGAVLRPRRRARRATTASSWGRAPSRSGTRSGTRAPSSTTPSARFSGMLDAAATDLRVALGLLDLRHLAGDPDLTLRLRTQVLAHWRRTAKDRLPELRQLVESRHQLMGELAHVSVPDLKEAEGGLRDAGVLKALVATWLVDVPHVDLERSRLALLDVRDVLHDVAGRATRPGRARRLGRAGAGARAARRGGGPAPPARARPADRPPLAADVAAYGRRAGPAGRRRRPRVGPHLEALAPGVALSAARWCSTPTPTPPTTRCSCCAPPPWRPSATSCCRPPARPAWSARARPLPEPWPEGARQLFVRLLAAGPGAARGLGDPRGDRRDRTGCCPSGSGSGCCRTRR